MNSSVSRLARRTVINATSRSRRVAASSPAIPWSLPQGLVSSSIIDSVSSTSNRAITTTATSNHQHHQARAFSTVPPELKTFPQYTVFAENCMLGMKVIMPTFRVKNGVLGVDASKRGRIVLEWVPRDADGRPTRDRNVRFALSMEECGLVLDQIPKNQNIVLTRRLPPSADMGYSPTEDVPDKVLHITPGQGGMASFKVDFELNGVGGQSATGHNYSDIVGPLEVVVQAGELQVMLTLMRDTIPHLSGWRTTLDAAMGHAIRQAISGGGSSYGGAGGPRFTSSEPYGNNDPPF